MTAPDLLRRLAEPALDAYQNTVTVTVPTRLLTALADELEAATAVKRRRLPARTSLLRLDATLVEVERAAREHTSQSARGRASSSDASDDPARVGTATAGERKSTVSGGPGDGSPEGASSRSDEGSA